MVHDCLTCRFAHWEKTKAGKLHPSGMGRCKWQFVPVAIPKAFYWVGYRGDVPTPSGGHIERRKPHEYCPTYKSKSEPALWPAGQNREGD